MSRPLSKIVLMISAGTLLPFVIRAQEPAPAAKSAEKPAAKPAGKEASRPRPSRRLPRPSPTPSSASRKKGSSIPR